VDQAHVRPPCLARQALCGGATQRRRRATADMTFRRFPRPAPPLPRRRRRATRVVRGDTTTLGGAGPGAPLRIRV